MENRNWQIPAFFEGDEKVFPEGDDSKPPEGPNP